MMRTYWDQWTPSGDSRKGMEAVYKLASLEEPPLHFPLGKDSIGAVREKTAALVQDTNKYESWSEAVAKSV